MTATAAAIVGAAVFSAASVRLVDFETLRPRPRLQPNDAAFGVAWTAIYGAAVVHAAQLMRYSSDALLVGSQLFASALALTSLWAVAMRSGRRRWALVVLVVACLLSLLSVVKIPSSSMALRVAPSLLAGWLAVASTIGLSLAGWTDPQAHPAPALLVLVLVLAALAVRIHAPALVLPALFAAVAR